MSQAETKFNQFTVAELHRLTSQSQIVIPEFQRGLVWTDPKRKLLFESLFRNFPIPAVILFEAKSTTFRSRKKTGIRPPVESVYYVVDGQQRINALSTLEKDEKRLYFDADKLTFRFIKGKPSENEFLLQQIWDTSGYEEIKDSLLKRDTRKRAAIERARAMLDTKIPAIVLQDYSNDDIIEIFKRINQGGTKLNGTEIEAADLARRDTGFVADAVVPTLLRFSDKYPILNQSVLFQACEHIALDQHKTSFQELDSENRRIVWKRADEAATELRGYLETELNIHHSKIIWSGTALIPLICYIAKMKSLHQGPDAKMVARWLVTQATQGRYGKSSEDDLAADLEKLKRARTPNNLLKHSAIAKQACVQFFGQKKYDGRQKFVLYVALAHQQCVNPFTKQKIVFSNGIDFHHIFPRSRFQDREMSDRIANIILVNEHTNRSVWKARQPADYLPEVKPELLDRLCIPSEYWQINQAEYFWSRRANLLADALVEYLKPTP
jgi:hypothetical protein